jgi:2-methylisocitrate lyase-like PEP mutase family enzyme
MSQQEERVATFRRLHEAGCFVMPNPWDVGSAVALERMGFEALATTSAGNAWSLGVPDNRLLRDQTLAHLRQVADAVNVPVNADFEGGFADDPEEVAANVKLAAATGVAGLSIEDSTGNADDPLYPFELAVERFRAARRAIDESGTGVLLTGRSEGFVVGRPDLTTEQVSAIVRAVAPKPVNLLTNAPFITVAEAASLGVRRISVGGTLARTAWAGFLAAAAEIAAEGTFTRFTGLPNVDAILRG